MPDIVVLHHACFNCVQRRRNLKEEDFVNATDAEYHKKEHYIEVSVAISILTYDSNALAYYK